MFKRPSSRTTIIFHPLRWNMDLPDHDLLDILSAGEADELDDQADQNTTNQDNFETPPPVLTIGSVLDTLLKLKSGA